MEKRLVPVHLRSGFGEMRACRVSTSTASQHKHLAGTSSSIPIIRLPIPTNSEGGMSWSEFVGRARRQAVAPAPDSCSRPWQRLYPSPPPTDRLILSGVPFLAAGPTNLCAQHVGPG